MSLCTGKTGEQYGKILSPVVHIGKSRNRRHFSSIKPGYICNINEPVIFIVGVEFEAQKSIFTCYRESTLNVEGKISKRYRLLLSIFVDPDFTTLQLIYK